MQMTSNPLAMLNDPGNWGFVFTPAMAIVNVATTYGTVTGIINSADNLSASELIAILIATKNEHGVLDLSNWCSVHNCAMWSSWVLDATRVWLRVHGFWALPTFWKSELISFFIYLVFETPITFLGCRHLSWNHGRIMSVTHLCVASARREWKRGFDE